MAKKRYPRSRVAEVVEQKKTQPQEGISLAAGARELTAVAEPLGSCRYADAFGQMQCESPVPKSYCDGKAGFFVPDGRC